MKTFCNCRELHCLIGSDKNVDKSVSWAVVYWLNITVYYVMDLTVDGNCILFVRNAGIFGNLRICKED